MKKIIYRILAILVPVSMLLASCTEEMSDVRLDPKLATSKTQNITSSSATVVGFVVAQGSGFAERGVCYNTAANPTTANSKVVFSDMSNVSATFAVTLSGLNYATTYYARAYALTENGTIYGEEITFTTLPVVPTVTTGVFKATSGTTASGGGEVTNDGGATVTARGVCYSTKPNPTVADSKTTDGTGKGAFTSSLADLKGLTTYYVRAYATNSAGTAYGSEVSFTTPQAIVTLWVAGDFQGWNPGAATDSLMNTSDNQLVRGYVYLPNTNGFKFVSQKNWDGPNYGAGDSDGKLSADGGAGNLSVSSPGYYYFTLDLANLTYTATKTTWGVIGSATAGGWAADQAMVYSSFFKQWVATIPLTAAEFKFRANGGWDLNYGDTGKDGVLDAGGDNIPVATAGTYTIMMNLSSPNNYKYTVTQWSITGDAAGGWGNDIDMVPNADNTWTVTATLSKGEFKFRANHDWTINLGGTPSNLSWGGSNIKIDAAGTYTIKLNLVNGTYSIQ